MVVNSGQELIDARTQFYFLVGFDHASLSDFGSIACFHV